MGRSVAMYRLVTHSVWSIIALICLLGGCDFANPISPQPPLALPSELSVEEHALKNMPEIEPLTFVPVESTQAEILSKHQNERSKHFSDKPLPPEPTISLGGDKLTAIADYTYAHRTDKGQEVSIPISCSVKVSRNGKVIYTIQPKLSAVDATPNLWGLWAYDNHWVIEVAHVTEKEIFSNIMYHDVFGEIIQDGISLNKLHGYQETFGFQLMKGKPFYFFKKQGWFGISYDHREIPLGYAQIPHYRCCSASALNPRSAENMVAFFARRGTVRPVWHYVEIGVFE
jgi:hypothetical protein